MIKVSIITVVLNGAKTIENTIMSVLGQDYPEMEYIIVDGGSTDGTLDIINKYRDRIDVFVSEPDRGLYDAMNKGIALSSGDIIGIINSDDWYETGVVKIIVDILEHHTEIEVLYGDVHYCEPGKTPYKYQAPQFKELWHLMSVNHPATFIRREIYEGYGAYDISFRICGDVEIMNRYWRKGVRFGHINRVLSNFRSGGLSCVNSVLNLKENKRIIEKYFEFELFYDCIQGFLPPKEVPLFIWGAGYWGEVIIKLLGRRIPIIGIYDTDESKWGMRIESIPVISPEEAGVSTQWIFVAIDNEEVDIMHYIRKECVNNCYVLYLKDCFRKYEKELVSRYGDCKEIFK